MRIFVLLASLVALLAGPAMADSSSFKARLGGNKVFGTVTAVSPTSVTVQTPDGVVEVPFARANFKLAGKRAAPSAITSGASLEVDYKGMTGMVIAQKGTLVEFLPNGATSSLTLPISFVRQSKVYVYTGKGDIVRVPIDQALAMQATPGTTVLGSDVPERYASDYGPSFGFGSSIYFGSPWYGGWGPGWGYGPRWGWGIGVGRGWGWRR